MKINMYYYYYGSMNYSVTLKKNSDKSVSIYTSYNELVSTIQSKDELKLVLTNLNAGKYDH